MAQRPTATSVHGGGATVSGGRSDAGQVPRRGDLQAAASLPRLPLIGVRTVLLTGANGYLGRFLALEWLQRLSRYRRHG